MEHYGNAFIFLSGLGANEVIQKSSPHAFFRKKKKTTLFTKWQSPTNRGVEKNNFYL